MIPVMVFGVLFAKKRYSLREYLCVGLITAGIITFNLSKSADKNKEVRAPRLFQRPRGGGAAITLISLEVVPPAPRFQAENQFFHFLASSIVPQSSVC